MSDPTDIDPSLFAAPIPGWDVDDEQESRLRDVREAMIEEMEQIMVRGTPSDKQTLMAKMGPMLFKGRGEQDAEAQIEMARDELRAMLERAGAGFFATPGAREHDNHQHDTEQTT